MTAIRCGNFDARKHVENCRDFKGNNTFGRLIYGGEGGMLHPDAQHYFYVAYSYGDHWPLYVCCDGRWFENVERYSVTTSKHRGQLRPIRDAGSITPMTAADMRAMVRSAESWRARNADPAAAGPAFAVTG